MAPWAGLVMSVLVFLQIIGQCVSWDQVELDLFDLVEEIGENFYDVMQLNQVWEGSELNDSEVIP